MEEHENERLMIERYKKMVERNRNYQRNNREKIKEIHRRYYEKFRQDEERLIKHREKRNEYYKNVVKPKRLAEKDKEDNNKVK